MRSPVGPGRVRVATARDLLFIRDLQRRFSAQLGFLPMEALGVYVDRSRVLLTRENGDSAGALVFAPALRCQPTTASIVQAAVRMDAQRRQHGLDLVAKMLTRLPATTEVVQAWCAEELEANSFWSSAGFQRVAVRDPGNTRGRRLVLWRLAIGDTSSMRIAALPERCGYRANKLHGQPIVQCARIEDAADLRELPSSWVMSAV